MIVHLSLVCNFSNNLTLKIDLSDKQHQNVKVPMVLPEPYFSLSDSRDTSCAIMFFSEPVPQLRDS